MARQRNKQKEADSTIEKLRILMPYWVSHNTQHIRDNEKWLRRIEDKGLKEVACELREAIELFKEANRHMELANGKMKEDIASEPGEALEVGGIPKKSNETGQMKEIMSFDLKQIGVIRTHYIDNAPYQPVKEDEGDFRIVVDPRYTEGLYKLDGFRYIYVIYYVHQVKREPSMIVSPSWAGGVDVGVFASRSPVRPNYIGLSIVRIKQITGNEILTSGLDVFDGTPVLDIKPYIRDLDVKSDANYGWIGEINDFEHLLLHIRGIPHDY
ncbi:MAG: tRNA (N6-threonylcarbamoyladenosine(37)-N6)-methyltransferase TrmO [Candidatus Altiarchaeota archaeon]|nr:tRNA (N6-threonylcarbamoyladenosine(37)-N6)-methyltransferase TrmO [Candidatus Altiarchaeota archaeon]